MGEFGLSGGYSTNIAPLSPIPSPALLCTFHLVCVLLLISFPALAAYAVMRYGTGIFGSSFWHKRALSRPFFRQIARLSLLFLPMGPSYVFGG